MHFENELHNEKQKKTKMKKQIELTVKARLLQRAFLLGILFLFNDVTPLALGQGENSNQSSTHARAQWVWQNPLPQGNHLFGLSFTDANNGTAVGWYGTILRTTDGGRHWIISRAGRPICFTGFHLSMRTTEPLWVPMEPSSKQPMAGTLG